MDDQQLPSPQLRKTRFVLISDTHNQTPKLPKGDVLIHAGDLTNQGSYSELKKTIQWIEKTDFQAKIVIAGNHDTTLDEPFFYKHCASFKWPKPQDPQACRRLLTDSLSITYLENQAATILLDSPNGPRTGFKVFGSPATPNNRNWAFKYQGEEEATRLWNTIPSDTDIVITHTPPKGHCDGDGKDGRFGCDVLLQALQRVRPMLAVCGHIHEARGIERLHWKADPSDDEGLVEGVDVWKDPGMGNNKQSLVDLTGRGGQPLKNGSALPRQGNIHSLAAFVGGQPVEKPASPEHLQASTSTSTSRLEGVSKSEAGVRALAGGAIEYRQEPVHSDIGSSSEPDVESVERRAERRETCVINAAFMPPRTAGPKAFNKPIVVDVDLPVWGSESDGYAQ